MTVDVSLKGVTARVTTASKETMSCGASKGNNKKGNMFTKKMRQQQLRLQCVMIVVMMPVVGREELWLLHLAKKQSKLGKKIPIKIKKAVSDWDNEKFDCVDKNGISFDKNRSKMKVLVEKLESPS